MCNYEPESIDVSYFVPKHPIILSESEFLGSLKLGIGIASRGLF